MKPARMDIFEEGSGEGEIIPLTLSAKDMPEVLMLLTDLYSKPKDACFREYSTNAWDAHVEAGVEDPIEILLPNALAPNLVIRDHGVGMSLDDVRHVFTQYGASTKREDDRLTGTLGMGCKSALAYCGQFTVKSVKDGWMILAQVSRKEDRTAALEVLEYMETDQRNGVEITIPRMSVEDFTEYEAQQFFQYWREGTVLIDGKPPKPLEGRRLGDSIVLQDSQRDWAKEQVDIVVMGNVPYRLSPQHRLFDTKMLKSGGARTVQVICYVKMGSVVFTPSREDLMYTTQTLRTLDKLRKEVTGRIKWMIQKDIEGASSHWEALQAHEKWLTEVGIKAPKIQYRGEDIPEKWSQEAVVHFTRTPPYRSDEPHRCTYSGSRHAIQIKGWMEYQTQDGEMPQVIVGAPFDQKPDKFMHSHFRLELRGSAKNKIRTWSILQGVTKAVVVPSQHPDPKWLSELRVIHWNDIKDLRMPLRPKADSYCVPLWDKTEFPVSQLPMTKILYCSPDQGYRFGRALGELGDGYTLVCLMPRRVDKFLRHRPAALPFMTVYKMHLHKLLQRIKQTDWQPTRMGISDREFFQALGNEVILNPEIKDLIRIASLPEDPKAKEAIKAYEEAVRKAKFSGDLEYQLRQTDLNSLYERYPLIRSLDLWSITRDKERGKNLLRHIVTYLNAAYLTLGPLPPKPHRNGNGKVSLDLVPYQAQPWWYRAVFQPSTVPTELDLADIPF